MLPDFLAGSYKRYKQDTALFTTWLAKAAASVGYKPDPTKRTPSVQSGSSKSPAAVETPEVPKASTRLKGKDRKAAKHAAEKAKKVIADNEVESSTPSTVKYTITTGDLLRQAEAVMESHVKSHIKMPTTLRAIVERAIRARRRCSEWFRKSNVRNVYADKQHVHFIEILEQSLKILEPCVEADDAASSHPKQAASLPDTASLTNRFSMLNVEESPDVDPAEVSAIAAAVNVATKSKASKGEPEIAVYELEDEDEFDEELAFVIFCQCHKLFRRA